MIVEIPSGENVKEVADQIRLYLPNALAFVFVLDVTNTDRSNDAKVSWINQTSTLNVS